MPTRWSVAHWITGHHYVHCERGADQMIRRVRYIAAGRAYVRYFGAHFICISARNPGVQAGEG